MNAALIATAISAAAGFGLAWQLQAGNITQLELDHAQQRIEIARANRVAAERATSAVAVAQNNAAGRAVVLRRDADGSRNAGNGLRLTVANTLRTSADDPTASTHAATALGAVFDACVTELQSLAEVADRHASDVQMMTEAWPK